LAHFKTLNTLRKQRISQQHSNKKFSTWIGEAYMSTSISIDGILILYSSLWKWKNTVCMWICEQFEAYMRYFKQSFPTHQQRKSRIIDPMKSTSTVNHPWGFTIGKMKI
jgi:hypothetical protein